MRSIKSILLLTALSVVTACETHAWQSSAIRAAQLVREEPQLVVIGENHSSVAQRRWVKEQLSDLKSLGYEALYIEAYPKDTKTDEMLRRKLSSSGHSEEAVNAFIDILTEARRLGMQVVPVDHDIPWKWTDGQKPTRAEFYSVYVVARNDYIVRNIARCNKPGVLLIGRNHIGIHDDPRQEDLVKELGREGRFNLKEKLKTKKITSTVISLCGGDESKGERHLFDLLADQRGQTGAWGAAPAAPLPGDYIVKLPNH